MLTAHNFITQPPRLMKQGQRPRVRLVLTSDQFVAEKVLAGLREEQCQRLGVVTAVRTQLWPFAFVGLCPGVFKCGPRRQDVPYVH